MDVAYVCGIAYAWDKVKSEHLTDWNVLLRLKRFGLCQYLDNIFKEMPEFLALCVQVCVLHI